jgi:hypothetical protein
MCSGARRWECWNSIALDGPLLAEKLVASVTAELYRLHGFDAQFRAIISAVQNGKAEINVGRERLAQEFESLQREKNNLVAAISEYGPRAMFANQLVEIDRKEKQLAWQRGQLDCRQNDHIDVPASVDALRQSLQEVFRNLATNSFEFGDLMRQLVSELSVYAVRLCDGGHPLARAKLKVNLAGSFSDIGRLPDLERLLTREFTLDLFRPPQRERIREEAVRLTTEGISQRCIGHNLVEKATQPAVQNAIALHRRMQELGLGTPYVVLSEPPADYPKLRRHKNDRYQFSMREGYKRPVI